MRRHERLPRAGATTVSEGIRRFYKNVSVADDAVMLDERRLRTPGGAPFAAPTRALAEAIAAEWNAQVEHIVPASMPLTQLAFAAIDVTPNRRDELAEHLIKYLDTDLVSHRADAPSGLVARQSALWDPILDWGQERFQFRLPLVIGIMPSPSASPQNRTIIQWEIDDLDAFRCTALAQAVTLAGSILIGFALLEGELGAEAAFQAAMLDDLWSLKTWGEDAEARARLDRQRAEFADLSRFIATLEAP